MKYPIKESLINSDMIFLANKIDNGLEKIYYWALLMQEIIWK